MNFLIVIYDECRPNTDYNNNNIYSILNWDAKLFLLLYNYLDT